MGESVFSIYKIEDFSSVHKNSIHPTPIFARANRLKVSITFQKNEIGYTTRSGKICIFAPIMREKDPKAVTKE